MIHFFPLKAKGLVRVALLVVLVLAGLGVRPGSAWASHIRAGDIQVKGDTTKNAPLGSRRVFFKMILYTDLVPVNGQPLVTQPSVTIFFGDGTATGRDAVPRTTPSALPIAGNTDTGLNIYLFEHTYPSTGEFRVSFIGENRNNGVLNMDRPGGQTFYISTTFSLDPTLLGNRSPVLLAPAVDRAGVSQVFLHNPAAFDADGDSLAFHLRTCQQVPVGVDGTLAPTGNNQPAPVVCTNYRYPNDPSVTPGTPPIQVPYNGVPPGVADDPAIFVQNVADGQITWNAPVRAGFYNVAMEVEEWRRTPLGRRRIGLVIRDMQIIVSATSNLRPTITVPADLCVIAGQTATGTVTATDGSSPSSVPTPITLFAYSGIIPPATFVQNLTGPPLARGTFTWQTDCRNVARLPYLVVFKAQDTPNPVTAATPPLIDEKTWRITVVGPPPQNLRATPVAAAGSTPNRVRLRWDPYVCANNSLPYNAAIPRIQIHIYRKIGTSNFVPGPCETGIPASAGYTRIMTLTDTATTFTDPGAGLTFGRGQTYCYRIYAEFPLPAGGASIASQEACASFPGNPSRLTKVDVENTGVANGQIQVCWTKPRLAAGPIPVGSATYQLARGQGLAPTAFTTIANNIALNDTCYTDSGINTQDFQYTYRLTVVTTSGPVPVSEVSPTASSVRTSAVPANPAATAVTVSWTYNVPWDNTARPAVIFRRTGNTGAFTRLNTAPTTATGGTYLDNDPALRKDETYCYYVLTEGRYADVSYLNSLLNRSQVRCLVLTSPPCTPVLVLEQTKCDSLASLPTFPGPDQKYTNRLRWTLSDRPTGCDAAIVSYQLFYRPTPTGRFSLLTTTTQTSFLHTNLAFAGGCYAVQAIGRSGQVSDTSNVACQDNCVFFKLPNIFTPNGDNVNAVFRPKNSSPVRSVHFKAFNRWGVKVFENTTTSTDRILINWDGGGPVGESGTGAGTKVSDGVYYYLAEVEFADFANTKRTYKGWVEIAR